MSCALVSMVLPWFLLVQNFRQIWSISESATAKLLRKPQARRIKAEPNETKDEPKEIKFVPPHEKQIEDCG